MALFRCEGNQDCVGLGIIASVIIGVIAAFLRITAVITVTPAFLWVLFGIAVVYLAVLLAATWLRQPANPCVSARVTLSVLLAGILGTILLSVILLAISFVATSVVGAILVGLLLLFFSLTVTASACLVKCLA